MPHDQKDKKDVESITWEDIGWSALKTTAVSAAAIGGAALLLRGTGFTDLGVRAGSSAAKFQSAYLHGTIKPGSYFSILQKVGAKGLPGDLKAAFVGISAVMSVVDTVLKKVRRNDETNSGNTSEETSEKDVDEETEDEAED